MTKECIGRVDTWSFACREAKRNRDLHFLAPGGGMTRKQDSPFRVWQSQMEQFASVGKDMAEAIVARYPSPLLLLQVFLILSLLECFFTEKSAANY